MSEFSFGDGNTANRIVSSILGDSWHSMFTEGPTGNLSELIVNTFQIFNSVVIAATALIVGYTLWSGVVQTAHEGKSMGKRYSSLWTPIRMAAGAALTAPVFGVSLVQMIVLAITAMSFSVADKVANELGTFMGKGGSLSISAPMTQRHDAHRLATALMYSETCMNYKNVHEGDSYIDPTTESRGVNLSYGWDKFQWRYGSPGLFGFGDKSCGAINISYSGLGEYSDDIKKGIEEMASAIRPAAESLVGNDDADIAHYKNTVDRYSAMISSLAKKAESGGSAEIQTASQKIQNTIRENGWINLGMWYYKIMSISAIRSQSLQFDFEVVPPVTDGVARELGGLSEYYNRAGGYVSRASSAMTGAGDTNPVEMKDLYEEVSHGWIDNIRMMLTKNNSDPFLAMVEVGQSTMEWGLLLFGGGSLGKAFGEKIQKIPIFGGTLNMVAGGAAWLGAVMIGVGAWLGWYLPMLPFVNWVIGVIGVFIAVAQSLFASQVWAAAHAMPEGEGIAGTHAKQGYMLLISLALRPILIVMGFIFSYYILWAGCWLALEGLKVYVETISSGGFSDVIAVLVALVVSAILVTTILHRALGFIFESADDILTWIGGGRQLGSEQQTVQRALGAFGMVITRGGTLRGMSSAMKGTRSLKENLKEATAGIKAK